MVAPRVLIVLNTDAAWSRGILRGFMAAAHERGWTLLHYHPNANLAWLADEWAPDAIVIGPEQSPASLARFAPAAVVSVNADRSAQRIASVYLDEERIAALALKHLLATGLRNLTTFRFDASPFAVAREQAFVARARSAGARVAPSWHERTQLPGAHENPRALQAWLRALPKPCGVFTCADSWGRVVARYARAARLRVPEDLALVGVDNDALECELVAPPLSSVVVPWLEVGKNAATLVQFALAKEPVAGKRVLISPIAVMARRSSELLAIDDALVRQAVTWIRAHADRRLTVTTVARAVGGDRQRLERRFRGALDRTVQEEIRTSHVEAAKLLLEKTRIGLVEVAKQSGFTNAALLSVAFQRELGMPPSVYRRRLRQELSQPEE
jgi:LacI family transcriptional regulator